MPNSWTRAEECLVPKEKNSESINQFRTISLLSVEGKIFFSILSKRLTHFLTKNKYIDTSVQKGGIPGFSGCVEHNSVVSQLIKETKEKKGDLTCIWLDLANAYGSIPHQVIMKAMEHYHVPDKTIKIIASYFQGIKLRFSFDQVTTDWLNLERGIITGCTISPIVFIMGMNLIIKAAERETRGPKMQSGIHVPANRGFMDDLTVTTTTLVQARWVLQALEDTVSWARMKFKPKKSRYMVIKKGRVTSRFKLKVQGEEIPSIVDNPVKSLGKWYDETLGDAVNKKNVENQVTEWLNRVDKTGLPGKFKAWVYQHGFLPRVMWPLMLYEFPMTTVETMERRINAHLRKWLGVPRGFTSIGLYSRTSELQLPLSSLVEEFKVAKCRLVMTLRDSQDEKIRRAGVVTRTGRKWAASNAIKKAEDMMEIRDIIGNVCSNRQGLGYSAKFKEWKKAGNKEKRDMVQGEIRREEEETRRARAVSLSQQGTWTRWNIPERRLTWQEIWRLEPFRISSLLKSVYDVLPSPVNLVKWGLVESLECKLCGGRGTMAHILSGCKVGLQQGRYRWRHDQVLRELADTLEKERKRHRPTPRKPQFIQFVLAGEKTRSTPIQTSSLLDGASWEMQVDLVKKLVFPPIVQTTLRPDIVLWSTQRKSIILVELTVPWEEGCDKAHQRKSSKYQELVEMCRQRGWKAWLFPVEVGCRGFPAQSVWRLFKSIGTRGNQRRAAVRRLGEQAERASCWLWHRREDKEWKPFSDTQ